MTDFAIDRGSVERAAALYLPIVAAALGWFITRPRGRVFAACLLGMLWTLPALLLLQRINVAAGWWTFATDGPSLLGLPLELWFGWAVLWGALPSLALNRLPLVAQLALLGAFDGFLMPLCRASLHLSPHWAVGEAVTLALVLMPSLLLQRWTTRGVRVGGRATLQVLTAALVFLYLPAELTFALHTSPGWGAVILWSARTRELLLQFGMLLALPGISAVQEFAIRGRGTPVPYDPPQRLVLTGVYRYIANPMQASCGLVMLVWALALRNVWLLIGPLLCVVYSAGLAAWDENGDLERRFGAAWRAYRDAVPVWRCRWRPYVPIEATVYIARGCEPCSRVRLWLEQRAPSGLHIVDAETLPLGSIQRMRYCCDGETVEGVRAIARCLEHLHAGWALSGAAMRLPLVSHAAQVFADGMGFGPRTLHCQIPGRENDAASDGSR